MKKYLPLRRFTGKVCWFDLNGIEIKCKVEKVVWDDGCRDMYAKIHLLSWNDYLIDPPGRWVPARILNLCA